MTRENPRTISAREARLSAPFDRQCSNKVELVFSTGFLNDWRRITIVPYASSTSCPPAPENCSTIGRQQGVPANLARSLLVDREPEGVAALGIDVEGAEGDGIAGLGLDGAVGVAAGDQLSVSRVPVPLGLVSEPARSSSSALLKQMLPAAARSATMYPRACRIE